MQQIDLVLLPGLDGTGLLFRPLLEALPPYINPIVVPYPSDVSLGYSQLLPMINHYIPVGRPFILLGESFGGPLSIQIAATMPSNLKALILSASFIQCPQRLFANWTASLIHPLPFRAFPLLSQCKRMLGGYSNDAVASLIKGALLTVKPEAMAHRMRDIVKVDVSAEFKRIECPILYLQGKRDWAVPVSNLQHMQSIKPEMQYAHISASHMLLQNQPKEAAMAISDFIQNTGV